MVPEGTPGKRRYGSWAGLPKGRPEDTTRCVEQVYNFNIPCQCSRKRGYGPDMEFCKQHAKGIVPQNRS